MHVLAMLSHPLRLQRAHISLALPASYCRHVNLRNGSAYTVLRSIKPLELSTQTFWQLPSSRLKERGLQEEGDVLAGARPSIHPQHSSADREPRRTSMQLQPTLRLSRQGNGCSASHLAGMPPPLCPCHLVSAFQHRNAIQVQELKSSKSMDC